MALLDIVKNTVLSIIPGVGVFSGKNNVATLAKDAGNAINSVADAAYGTAQKIKSYVAEATAPKTAQTFKVGEGLTPKQQTAATQVIQKNVQATPVGTPVKVPFVQKEVLLPQDAVSGLLKGFVEYPEKIVTSIAEVPEFLKEAVGISQTGIRSKQTENKAYSVDTYQADVRNYTAQFVDAGYTPGQAAALAFGIVGSTVILDVATAGSFIKAGTKSILKNIAPVDIEAEASRQFLGLRSGYTAAERETTYRSLAKELHPDVAGGSAEAFSKVSAANDILKVAETKGVRSVIPKSVTGPIRRVSEILQNPVGDLFKGPSATAYANVKGLLPEIAGTRPDAVYRPYNTPAIGFSTREINAKPIVKEASTIVPGQGVVSAEKTLTLREAQAVIDEANALRTALRKAKGNYVSEYLNSSSGSKLLMRSPEFQTSPFELNRKVVQGIKNSEYFKVEGGIVDDMGRGWLMEKNGKYIVSETTTEGNYLARGYRRVIEIDSLASEAGIESGEEYLKTMLHLSQQPKVIKNIELAAHKELLKIDPNYQALTNKIDQLTKEVKQIYDSEISTLAEKIVATPRGAARLSEEARLLDEAAFSGGATKGGRDQQLTQTVGSGIPQQLTAGGSTQSTVQKSSQLPQSSGIQDTSLPTNTRVVSPVDRQKAGYTYPNDIPRGGVTVKPPPPTVRGGIQPPKLNFTEWKDKGALSLSRETFERNIESVAGKDAAAVKKFISDPIRANDTARVEFMNAERADVRSFIKQLDIKGGSLEDRLIQAYGERRMTLAELKQATPKWQEVIDGAKFFRDKYDDLLKQINDVRGKFGYTPIPKRADYFRHFQEVGLMIDNFGVILGKHDIPTELAGITDMFKPGKPFTNAEIRRLGGKFTESAIRGFDNYLDAVSKQIYHTDSVQRARALEQYIRETAEAGAATGERVYLPNFVSNIQEYGNILAGKKTTFDRPFERYLGRTIYNFVDKLKGRSSANLVGGNISSALTNFIPVTQFVATTQKGAAIRGMFDTVTRGFGDFFVVDGLKSSFLTRRFPNKHISPTVLQKAVDLTGAMFEAVDRFVARSIVSGKYFELTSRGLDKATAIKFADEYAGRIMADRTVGQLPNIQNIKSLGFLTQFQVEVNNAWSFILKDIPKYAGGDSVGAKRTAKIFSAFIQFFAASYAFNTLFEKISGRRPTLDPIYYIQTILGRNKESQDLSILNRVKKTFGTVLNNIPYIGGILGGRLPVLAEAFNFPIGDLLSGKTTLDKELYKPVLMFITPVGGNQFKKTVEGLGAVLKGEQKSAAGKLRYEIEQSPGNFIRGIIFGKYAFNEAREARTAAESLGQKLDEQAANSAKLREEAENLYEQLKRVPAEQANEYVSKLQETDPLLVNKLYDVADEEKKNLTTEDRMMKQLGVENGERAKEIFRRMMRLKTDDEKNLYFETLDSKGLISDAVYDQLVELVQTANP